MNNIGEVLQDLYERTDNLNFAYDVCKLLRELVDSETTTSVQLITNLRIAKTKVAIFTNEKIYTFLFNYYTGEYTSNIHAAYDKHILDIFDTSKKELQRKFDLA